MWNHRYDVITVCHPFILVSTASSVSRGVCPSVWHDRGGFRPAGSMEEKRAQETGPTVLITYGRLSNTAITRGKDMIDYRRGRGERDRMTSAQFHCHGWEPVLDLLIWRTKFWSHQRGLLRYWEKTAETLCTDGLINCYMIASATVAVCWSGV